MTEPAAPHPEDPNNPAAPQASHPTGPRTPPLENLTDPTASQAGHPAKPRTPWAEGPTNPTAPHAGHRVGPVVPQVETPTAAARPADHTAETFTPQAEAPINSTAPQTDHPTNPLALQTETPTSPAPRAGHTANPLTPQVAAPSAPQTDYPTNSLTPQLGTTDPLAELAERIEDLTRVIARQATTVDRLADEAKARDRRDRAGGDLPLVLELFALHTDTTACATTAESERERAAFEAIATRIERLVIGRGGTLITPRPGDAFDSLTMEAADVTKTDDPALDRTVASVVQTGLTVSGRSVRPAGVVVRRHR